MEVDTVSDKIVGSGTDFKLIKQGAEAKLYSGTFLGKRTIVKERFKKQYRHPDLDDRLTKERVRAEVRGIMRSKNAGIRTPAIYMIHSKTNSIYMEELEGVHTVNAFIGNLLKDKESGRRELEELANEVGKTIGKLHEAGIIHGDLTTSNILVEDRRQSLTRNAGEDVMMTDAGADENQDREKNKKYDVALIDFGLSHVDNSAEDKGVDLYVLERALTSTHSSIDWFFELILQSYISQYVSGGKDVYVKLEEIRLRGRKRTMVG